VIPWTISNKYYTADVHFFLEIVSGNDSGPSRLSSVQEDEKVPAIIFVFTQEEVSVVSNKPGCMPMNPVVVSFLVSGSS
jgi:hypothetical protein